MFRSSAPPLRLALKTDRILPAISIFGLCLAVGGVTGFAAIYSSPVLAVLLLPVATFVAWWTWRQRPPNWAWLGCDLEGGWWLATREGLRLEQRVSIRLSPETRVGLRLVVLVYRFEDSGTGQALWLPWWRLDPQDFRRLRVRLRWPPERGSKLRLAERLRDGRYRMVAMLSRLVKAGDERMTTLRDAPSVEPLLRDDPAHEYSEDELDAIEALDPELALRLDRAQTFASRPAEIRRTDAPIDEDGVRQAVDAARSILMQDGGDIEYVGLEGRTVKVRMKGACVGCPRSALDLRHVVERLVRSRSPGVDRVANTF